MVLDKIEDGLSGSYGAPEAHSIKTGKVRQMHDSTQRELGKLKCVRCNAASDCTAVTHKEGILFRGYAMCSGVFQERIIVSRSDRSEVAMRDPFGPREFGDVI